jgi:hypothetical protein
MRLIIRSVSIWGHPNIRTWEPIDPTCFAETVNVDIGSESKKGADRFSIRLATPAGLSKLDSHNGIIAVRPLLIVDSYDYDTLWRWLTETVKSCEAETWNSSIDKLRIYFDYEYDDYKVWGDAR